MPEARHEDAAWLRTPDAVRARANEILALGVEDRLEHFAVDLDAVDRVAAYVVEVTRASYPDLQVPIHGRFRHFEVGGVDRVGKLREKLEGRSPIERARALVDLVVPSVLLDAGAGPSWRYVENGVEYARSEGLAVASFAVFEAGYLSSRTDDPYRADAVGLARCDADTIAHGFQVGPRNPIVGLEGRAGLIRALGEAVGSRPDVFGREDPRVGGLVDHLAARADDHRVAARDLLAVLLDALSPIWPGRVVLDGVNLGDVWPHPQVGLVPFHKLSQWLAYSLVEPLAEAGLHVVDLDVLTGLPEYRNGGLLVDLGALRPKHSGVTAKKHAPGEPVVVEWRALTVALLDRVGDAVRRALAKTPAELPLANVLQGGTWTAGRKVAADRREGGGPPIEIDSDGTVF